MDESLSWRAKFAKSNINILNLTLIKTEHGIINRWFVEFTYHPKPGTFKWCKTYIDIMTDVVEFNEDDEGWAYARPISDNDIAQTIMDEVLKLRKELEA